MNNIDTWISTFDNTGYIQNITFKPNNTGYFSIDFYARLEVGNSSYFKMLKIII